MQGDAEGDSKEEWDGSRIGTFKKRHLPQLPGSELFPKPTSIFQVGKSFILPLLSSSPLFHIPPSVPKGTHITPHGIPSALKCC